MKKLVVAAITFVLLSTSLLGKKKELTNAALTAGEQKAVNPVALHSSESIYNGSNSTRLPVGIASFILPHPSNIFFMKGRAGDQNEWRHCQKCSGLFYNGFRDKGHCAAGQGHVSDNSRDYILAYDSPGPGQRDWRFCNKCHGLFFDGYPKKGVCKGGGGHAAAGFNFSLRSDLKAPGEKNWRFCNKCQLLFLNETQYKGGVCPAGAAHVAAGFYFVVDSKHYTF